MSTNHTLGKQERLKSNLRIQELLKNGHKVSRFPLKVYWTCGNRPQKYPVRMAVIVPKHRFKRAVDRNLMKRRIREAYRLNKNLVYEPLLKKDLNISMIILFLSDEFISFDSLETGIRELLQKLVKNLP